VYARRSAIDGGKSALDFNGQTHPEFMFEEEKLARDVYITPGPVFPNSRVFGNIDDSEERQKSAVADMPGKYAIPNPGTNDTSCVNPQTCQTKVANTGIRYTTHSSCISETSHNDHCRQSFKETKRR
jgi:hypothetical protein